jgi:hypothetical protein
MFEDRHEEEWDLDKRLDRIIHLLEKIYRLENRPNRMIILWTTPQHDATIEDNTLMANDVTLNLTAPFGSNQGVPVEINADGTTFVFDPTTVAWAVQDSTVASFVSNPDGSATFTPLKAGSTGVAVSDSKTGLSAQGTLTVTGGVSGGPVSMSINWVVPGSPAAVAALSAARKR